MKKVLKSKFFKYGLGGAINYGLKLGLTFLLTEVLALYYLFSYAITLVVVILYSFLYNMFITFNKTADKLRTFVKYVISLVIFGAVDLLFVKLITDQNGEAHYMLSIIIVTTCIFVAKYFVLNKFVFNK